MNYGRTMRLAAAGSLLALISHAVHADVLIDTGLPTSNGFSTLCRWGAGQIVSRSALKIDGVQHYLQANSPVEVRITLRTDEGGLPGTVLFSANHLLTAGTESFQGPTGLNWSVGPGTYWFTFEQPYADPSGIDCDTRAALRRMGFTTDDPRPEFQGTAPPYALAREALFPLGGSVWMTNTTRLGWRVTGTQGAVVVNGREWRQLTEVAGFTWSQVATVCNSESGACSGSLGGVSFDGWTWASNQDVQALFEELIRPGTVEFPTPTSDYIVPDSPDVAAALGPGGFSPTAFSSTRVSGWTRTAFMPPQLYHSPSLVDGDGSGGSSVDIACLNCLGRDIDTGPYRGVWLYRDAYAGTLSLSLSASTAPGCRSVTGTLALSEPAPVGGALVTLSDTLAQATMPAAVAIPAGETTASFLITTTPVSGLRSGSVSASLAGQTVTQPLTLRPIGLASLRLDPLSVVGSQAVVGQAQLECPAGPGPIVVNLESSNPTLANPVTPYLVIPQGVQSQQFNVTTNLVPTNTTVQIVGTANDTRRSRGLGLKPPMSASTANLRFGQVRLGILSEPLSVTVTNESAVFAWVNAPQTVSLDFGGRLDLYWEVRCNTPPTPSCTILVRVMPWSGSGKFASTGRLFFTVGTVTQTIDVSVKGTVVP